MVRQTLAMENRVRAATPRMSILPGADAGERLRRGFKKRILQAHDAIRILAVACEGEMERAEARKDFRRGANRACRGS